MLADQLDWFLKQKNSYKVWSILKSVQQFSPAYNTSIIYIKIDVSLKRDYKNVRISATYTAVLASNNKTINKVI